MADNVAITAGSGTTIATDQCGTDHYQKVKLTDGTADATTAIAAGNGTNGGALRVTLASDSTGVVQLAAGTAGIGKLTANSGVDIGDVDVTSLPADTVVKRIAWSHYSNEYTTTQTSTDLVALSGSTVFYVGRLTIGTGGTTSGLVTIYYGTGAYSAGTSKTLFRGSLAPASTAYPGVVIGDGSAPFCISGAGDALKITTSANITVYVQVDYIRV